MAVEYTCCETKFFLNIGIIVFLVIFAGLMSGLTLGLMSLSLVDLEVLAKSGTPKDRKYAGVKLVATPFEGTGYGGWKRSMLIALSAKNKLGFIDGSIPQPSSSSATANKWQRCNDIVFSWILNSVSPEIAESILYSGTAEIAWKELEDRFGQTNGAQLYSIQKKLTDFSQGNDNISTYFTKVKAIWNEFTSMGMNPKCSCNCNCGAKEKQIQFQEYQKAVQFLMGLNDSYAVIRGTILMQNPLPKLAVVYNILLQEERQREIHSSSSFQSDSAAMLAKNVPFKGNGGYNNNTNGSWNGGYKKNFQGHNKNGGTGYQNNKGYAAGNGYNPNYKGKNPIQNPNQGFNNQNQGFNSQNPPVQQQQDRPPPPFCNYCKKYGHTVDGCYHLMNKNRRFAGNVFHDEQGNASGSHAQEAGPSNSGNDHINSSQDAIAGTSSANFAGLFQEALDPW